MSSRTAFEIATVDIPPSHRVHVTVDEESGLVDVQLEVQVGFEAEEWVRPGYDFLADAADIAAFLAALPALAVALTAARDHLRDER
jgi:hypothetical protein